MNTLKYFWATMNVSAGVGRLPIRSSLAIPTFAATLFLSAGLMFLVEPMIAKMVLPKLGGAASVWSACLVFFQTMLLLGYAYAHLLTRLSSRLAQVGVHVCILLPLSAIALPLTLGPDGPSADQSAVLWLLLRLSSSCGIPIFAISATAPLLQHWFADGDHKGARDPYFLYAVSNAGSLLALLAYPLVVEPELPLDRQATFWSAGFAVLALGVASCAAIMLSERRRPGEPTQVIELSRASSTRDRLIWTGLAFIPSSLLLGVTQHITSDIVSAPLLWVLPLTLYLLTFIFAFARRPPLPHAIMKRAFPVALILVVAMGAGGIFVFVPLPIALAFHLSCFFVISMTCHGELAKRRPSSAQLTEFYFFLSLGGVLGGVFNALIAPLIFKGVWEYPLALIAACLVRPPMPSDRQSKPLMDIVLPLLLLAVLLVLRSTLVESANHGPFTMAIFCVPYLVLALTLVNFSQRRWRFAIAVALVFLFPLRSQTTWKLIAAERSFFGVYRVEMASDAQAPTLVLMNGTTLHGAKSLRPGEATLFMTYYTREGPFGRFFNALPQSKVRRVAVIGLGAGSLACYAKEGQDWTFYEIDPVVEQLARDRFHFLEDCAPHSRVVLGDARMTIGNAPDGAYDVLVVDAFSSDSIPMHLLTREALALYLRKLAPGGHILFHVSSRRLTLAPVVGALATNAGLPARILFDIPPPGTSILQRSPAIAVVVAGRDSTLDPFSDKDGWKALPAAEARYLWTDQRADIWRVISF